MTYISEAKKREMIGELLRMARAAELRGDVDESHYLYDEAAQVDTPLYVEMLAELEPAALPEDPEFREQQQQRAKLTREVIELLGRSWTAWAAGDEATAVRLGDEAATLDPDAFVVITGGMRIGEIPNPQEDPDGWAAFVAAAS